MYCAMAPSAEPLPILPFTVYREGADTACAAFPSTHIWWVGRLSSAAGLGARVLASVSPPRKRKSPSLATTET